MSSAAPAAAASPNAAQIEYWNLVAGPRWVGIGAGLDNRMARVHERLLAAASIGAGQSVLDVGCGTGTTTLACAERVGNAGRVTGIDVSTPMLEAARRRIAGRGLANVSLIEADASLHPFAPHGFDRIVSRFGVMFFADPVSAFRNLFAAMRTDGQIAFVCWAPLADNPFWRIPVEIAERAVGPRAPEPERAPGPMAFSDVTWVRFILESAGFRRVGVATEAVSIIGETPDEEAGFACRMGPAARLIEERAPSAALRDSICREIATSFAPFAAAGTTLLPATVHVVTAARAT